MPRPDAARRETWLLSEVDRGQECLSGADDTLDSKAEIRAVRQRGECALARASQISVVHLYNLRKSVRYRKQAPGFAPTRPSPVSSGERRKPDRKGGRGFGGLTRQEPAQ